MIDDGGVQRTLNDNNLDNPQSYMVCTQFFAGGNSRDGKMVLSMRFVCTCVLFEME
jgi:hypothetical protein